MSNKRYAAVILIVLPAILAMSGCAHAINPFADDAVPAEEMITASERKVRENPVAPQVRKRDWQPTATSYPSGQVIHWPLWFEDPFEDKGSEDGKFAWTEEDYIAIPYSFARLLLNTMGWPVSAIVTPPGTPMVSDGRLSRQALGMDHDAIPLSKAAQEKHQSLDAGAVEDDGELVEGPEAPAENVALEGPPVVETAGHQE